MCQSIWYDVYSWLFYLQTHLHNLCTRQAIYVCAYYSGMRVARPYVCTHTHTHTCTRRTRWCFAAVAANIQTQCVCVMYNISITVAVVADVLFLFLYVVRAAVAPICICIYKRNIKYMILLYFFRHSFTLTQKKNACRTLFCISSMYQHIKIFSFTFHSAFYEFLFEINYIACFHGKTWNAQNKRFIWNSTIIRAYFTLYIKRFSFHNTL